MGIMSATLRSLFPRGSAWRLPGNLGAVIEGLADTLERVRTFLRAAITEAVPGSAVSMLPEWHAALGRRYDATQTVANQQRMLAAVHTARGGVGLVDLNGQMHKELAGVNFSELAYGPTSRAGLAVCGIERCGSVNPGTDANPYMYLVSGTVQNNNEAARVASVIAHFAPLHLLPSSILTVLSASGTSKAGLDTCGIARCNAT